MRRTLNVAIRIFFHLIIFILIFGWICLGLLLHIQPFCNHTYHAFMNPPISFGLKHIYIQHLFCLAYICFCLPHRSLRARIFLWLLDAPSAACWCCGTHHYITLPFISLPPFFWCRALVSSAPHSHQASTLPRFTRPTCESIKIHIPPPDIIIPCARKLYLRKKSTLSHSCDVYKVVLPARMHDFICRRITSACAWKEPECRWCGSFMIRETCWYILKIKS